MRATWPPSFVAGFLTFDATNLKASATYWLIQEAMGTGGGGTAAPADTMPFSPMQLLKIAGDSPLICRGLVFRGPLMWAGISRAASSPG